MNVRSPVLTEFEQRVSHAAETGRKSSSFRRILHFILSAAVMLTVAYEIALIVTG